MDPDANLLQQLALVQLIHDGEDSDTDKDELADLVHDLHVWLSNGGFLPRLWGEGR